MYAFRDEPGSVFKTCSNRYARVRVRVSVLLFGRQSYTPFHQEWDTSSVRAFSVQNFVGFAYALGRPSCRPSKVSTSLLSVQEPTLSNMTVVFLLHLLMNSTL
jgi:hypothetical protein